MQLPAANCHPLTGEKKAEWAVNISANHRLILRLPMIQYRLKGDGSIDIIKVTDIRIIEQLIITKKLETSLK
jgi:proteic killer suppression protein